MEEQKQIRCAIYTRKSTDEGLEKEFNTLEAQREAGENFVMSMKHQGWVILPERYDGFSGGNLKRPALKRLMADVEKGIVDMIVVYKIDRLTRSLLDFAQLVQTFEKNNCSFVSVTQHFNTCDSMGKLTLNILLSFAQFERELGAERVRDKIAASKKKGMWTGGAIPLGYDVNNKKLVINPAEAETIRFIFEDYKRTRSQIRTVEDLNEKGFKPKTWKTKTGKIVGCEMFNHAMISNILNNPIYIGMVPYKGELYKGQHKAIITQELWDETRKVKKDNIGTAFRPCRSVKNSLLKGLLECSCCGTMTPKASIIAWIAPDWSRRQVLALNADVAISQYGWVLMRNVVYNSSLSGYINGNLVFRQYGNYGHWEEYNSLMVLVCPGDIVRLSGGGELAFMPCKGV